MKLFINLSIVSVFLAISLPFNSMAGAENSCHLLFLKKSNFTLEELLVKESAITKDASLGWGDNNAAKDKMREETVLPYLKGHIKKSLENAKTIEDVIEVINLFSKFYSIRYISRAQLPQFMAIIRSTFPALFSNLSLKQEDILAIEKVTREHTRSMTTISKWDYESLYSDLLVVIKNKFKVKEVERFVNHETRRQKFSSKPYKKGFIYWLAWEAIENRDSLQQPIEWVEVKTTHVPLSKVTIQPLEGLVLPLELGRDLINETSHSITWPHHPRNTNADTPFQPGAGYRASGSITMHYTASRSMVLRDSTLSLKLPTDNPTPKENSPSKADMRNSVKVSLSRGNLIRRIDSNLKADPRLKLLYDVAAVVDSHSGNGFTVRDLSILNNGNYWLPTQSINTMGARIAKTNTLQESRGFWIRNFLKPMARAKALLLIRYGLQLKFPHLQNSILELTPNLTPTGLIAIRDLSDSSLVRPIAEVIAQKELQEDLNNGFRVLEEISPALGENTTSNDFRQSTAGSLAPELLFRNYEQHNKIKDEASSRLDHLSELTSLEKLEETFFIYTVINELKLNRKFESIKDLQEYLFSPEGLEKIKAYHQQLQVN